MASIQRKTNTNNRAQNPRTIIPREKTDDMSTFDKLMLYLTKVHPEYSIADFTDALYRYRQEQQTLAGLSLTQIEEGILNNLQNKNPSEQVKNGNTQVENSNDESINESVAAALWRTFKKSRERGQSISNKKNESTSTDDQCLICLESLHSNKTETFNCQHTFHRNCLEEWFKIERTCPLCRKLLLFNDEFPSLT